MKNGDLEIGAAPAALIFLPEDDFAEMETGGNAACYGSGWSSPVSFHVNIWLCDPDSEAVIFILVILPFLNYTRFIMI